MNDLNIDEEILKKIDKGIKINSFFNTMKFLNCSTSDNFVSSLGLKFRELTYPLSCKIIKKLTNKNIIIKKFQIYNEEILTKNISKNIQKDNKPKIYVMTHSSSVDVTTCKLYTHQNAFLVLGMTEQFRINPKMLLARLTGMIHFFKDSNESKNELLKKCSKILNKNNSIVIFAEGGLNNTCNDIIMPLFSGFYNISKSNNVEIVPVAINSNYNEKNVNVLIGDSINYSDYSYEEAKIDLRDKLATMMWYIWEENNTITNRSSLNKDHKTKYFTDRLLEYMQDGTLWDPRTNDTWIKEELRGKKEFKSETEIYSFLKNVKLNKENYKTLLPILLEYYEKKNEEDCSFYKFAEQNWTQIQKDNYIKTKKYKL